jgi:ferredoxin
MGWLWACLGGGGPTSKEQRHCSKTFIHHQSKVSGEISLSLPCYSSDPSPPHHSLLFFFTVSILIPHCRECKVCVFFCSLAAIQINPQCIIAPSYPDQPSEHVEALGCDELRVVVEISFSACKFQRYASEMWGEMFVWYKGKLLTG